MRKFSMFMVIERGLRVVELAILMVEILTVERRPWQSRQTRTTIVPLQMTAANFAPSLSF